MCGIFGAINTKGFFNNSDFSRFKGLTDIVNYRGPDAEGYVGLNTTENSGSESLFNIFLGHKRLSIIDLSADGTQPFCKDDLYLIFNGEIFNYIELREALIKRGCTFRTQTDTEVILELYKLSGEESFAQLNGMWAFILVDVRKKKVVVSRDRFSIKPLYYHKSDSAIYFASEIKQLLPLLSNKSVNKRSMYAFLHQTLLDHNNETFFEDINKLPPKTNMIIDLRENTFTLSEYWSFTSETYDERHIVEEFKELFTDSVRIRLRSDVKVGSLLSGGLDSSSITVIGNQIQQGNLSSFSVISSDKTFSEEKFIDSVVHHSNLPNTKLNFEPSMVLEYLDKVLYHQDEPFGTMSVIAQHLIFKKIKEETDIIVVMSGQGGDEILMGYLKYFFFNLKNLVKHRHYLQAGSQVLNSLFNRTALLDFNLGHAKKYMVKSAAKFPDYLLLKEGNVPIWQADDLRQRQIMDIDRYSIPILAHHEDRNAMAYGLEVRHPFLDHRLVNFVLNQSVNLKIKNGWSKYLLRKAMPELPPDIRWRRDKKGFTLPDERWLRNDLYKVVNNAFQNSVLDELGIINKGKFVSFYNDFVNEKGNIYYNDVLRVFIAEMWAKKFLA